MDAPVLDEQAAVDRALSPGGQPFFVASAPDHRGPAGNGPPVRCLDDGRETRIIAPFHDAATLAGRLAALGWTTDVQRTDDDFIPDLARRDPCRT